MASYIVMEPPSRSEDVIFVRDGFHLLAFLIPFAWLLWHRLWIEGLVALAAALALGLLGSVAGFTNAAPFLSLLVAIYVGLEGVALKIAAFRRRGWREWGVVEAANREEAEIRYEAEIHGDPAMTEGQAPARPGIGQSRPADTGPALGLFAYPGRN